MSFTNDKIDLMNLPAISAEQYDKLDQSYVKVIWLEQIIIPILIFIAYGLTYFFGKLDWLKTYEYLPIVIVLIVSIFFTWFRLKAFGRKGYQLRQHDIIYKSGLWWQEEIAIPFVRVQHSEITQGPIGRWFGFATLKLYTAGGSRSDLSIPALRFEKAKKLKAFIAQKTNDEEPII